MKQLLIIVAVFVSSATFAQKGVHAIFDKYQDVDGITSIKVERPMFNLLDKLNLHDQDIKKLQLLLGKINSINILISGADKLLDHVADIKPGLVQQGAPPPGLQNEINTEVKKLKYDELVTINSGGRKIKLMAQNASGDVVHNLLLSITGSDQNVLMLLDGEISMNELNKFISEEK